MNRILNKFSNKNFKHYQKLNNFGNHNDNKHSI